MILPLTGNIYPQADPNYISACLSLPVSARKEVADISLATLLSCAMNTFILPAMLRLVDTIIALYVWTLIAYVAMSWLINFRIINPYQPLVRLLWNGLVAAHEPFLLPIRRLLYRILPDMGGIDFSPLVALLLANLFVGPLAKDLILFVGGGF